MLSRVADSLYWMSRYIERAEHTTRLLDVNLNLMLDESAASADRRWQRMLHALGNPKSVVWAGDPYDLTRSLIFDTGNKASILSCIISARENSRQVREQISTEQWQRLNSLFLQVTRPELQLAAPANSEQPTEFLQQVIEAIHQFQGVTDSTMSHGEGWHFIQVGRYIERATATALLLEAYHADLWSQPEHDPRRQRVPLHGWACFAPPPPSRPTARSTPPTLPPTASSNSSCSTQSFPTPCASPSTTCSMPSESIDNESGKSRAEPLRRLSGRLQAMLSYSSVDEILTGDVVAYLRGIQIECRAIHEAIYNLYIDYSVQAALAG